MKKITPLDKAQRKLEQKYDAKLALAEHEAQMIAVRKKTDTLRALRLARESEIAAAAPAIDAAKPGARKPRSAAKPTAVAKRRANKSVSVV